MTIAIGFDNIKPIMGIDIFKPRSFAQLDMQKTVRAASIIRSLKDYATLGAAVRGETVNELMDRAVYFPGFRRHQLNRIAHWADVGLERQKAHDQKAAVAEYAGVSGHADFLALPKDMRR